MKQTNLRRAQAGSAAMYGVLIFAIILLVGVGAWVVYKQSQSGSPSPSANNPSVTPVAKQSEASKPLSPGSDDGSLAEDIANLTASVDEGAKYTQSAEDATNDESKVIDVPISSGSLGAIKKGASSELNRRIANLKPLTDLVNADSHASNQEKTMLANEVKAHTAALSLLKTEVNSASSIDLARINAQPVQNNYYRYAFIVARTWQWRVAGDQQLVEDKFNTLSGKLQTRVNKAQAAGKDMAAQQNVLNDIIAKVASAQKLSSQVSSGLPSLEATDYTNDHRILAESQGSLKASQAELRAILVNAKTVVHGLAGL